MLHGSRMLRMLKRIILLLQAQSTFGANSVIGARAATVMGYNQAPDTQLPVLELGFQKPVMPAGFDLV